MIRPSALTAILNRSAAAGCTRRSKIQPSASRFVSYPAQSSSSSSSSSPSRSFVRRAKSFSSGGSTAGGDMHGTTILCVRKDGKVCMMGDGQVSMGSIVVKPNAKKIRRILPKTTTTDETTTKDVGGTLVGFAGSTADAFTLLERLESKLDEYPDQLTRSCVELAKGWRTDKYLRRLEASLLVADGSISLELTGNGDVLESHDGVLSVGSGSPYASAAARALIDIEDLDAEEVARRAMEIASDMCVYTNKNFMVETIHNAEPSQTEKNKMNAAAAEAEKDS